MSKKHSRSTAGHKRMRQQPFGLAFDPPPSEAEESMPLGRRRASGQR